MSTTVILSNRENVSWIMSDSVWTIWNNQEPLVSDSTRDLIPCTSGRVLLWDVPKGIDCNFSSFEMSQKFLITISPPLRCPKRYWLQFIIVWLLHRPPQANQLAEFYLGGTSNIRPENFYNITDMFTDAFVTYPMECFVEYARKTQPVFQYIYSHQVQHFDTNLTRTLWSLPLLGWIWFEPRCWTAQVWCQPWRRALPHVNLLL